MKSDLVGPVRLEGVYARYVDATGRCVRMERVSQAYTIPGDTLLRDRA